MYVCMTQRNMGCLFVLKAYLGTVFVHDPKMQKIIHHFSLHDSVSLSVKGHLSDVWTITEKPFLQNPDLQKA